MVFHRLTQFFSLLVLLALAGIIVSLFINALAHVRQVRCQIPVVRMEWDIIEEFWCRHRHCGHGLECRHRHGHWCSTGTVLLFSDRNPLWLRRPLITAIELLAAVPSIIYGMFGLFVFAPVYADYLQVPLQSVLVACHWWAGCLAVPPTDWAYYASIILALWCCRSSQPDARCV